jgi:hypothetical protein
MHAPSTLRVMSVFVFQGQMKGRAYNIQATLTGDKVQVFIDGVFLYGLIMICSVSALKLVAEPADQVSFRCI